MAVQRGEWREEGSGWQWWQVVAAVCFARGEGRAVGAPGAARQEVQQATRVGRLPAEKQGWRRCRSAYCPRLHICSVCSRPTSFQVRFARVSVVCKLQSMQLRYSVFTSVAGPTHVRALVLYRY